MVGVAIAAKVRGIEAQLGTAPEADDVINVYGRLRTRAACRMCCEVSRPELAPFGVVAAGVT